MQRDTLEYVSIDDLLSKLSADTDSTNTLHTQLAETISQGQALTQSFQELGAEAVASTVIAGTSQVEEAQSLASALADKLQEAHTTFETAKQHLTGGSPAGSATQRPVSTLTTHGVTHGTVQRRAGIFDGPVIFSAPSKGATPNETGQAQEYADAANRARREGRISSRKKLDFSAIKAKDRAALQERKRAEAEGKPYGDDVAAHLPDTTWGGDGNPIEGWGRHTKGVNSSLGAQSAKYPVGYRPTEFMLDDSWPDESTS